MADARIDRGLMMFWIVILPFVAALPAVWAARRLGDHAGWLMAVIPLGIAGWLSTWVASDQLPLQQAWAWVPGMGVELALRLDGLSLTFALLISFIGALVLIYAGGYMHGDDRAGRLMALLLIFMGAMIGLVLADDLISLFVFWELTSISSFLLIGFNHQDAGARKSARRALLVTSGGGLALLAGLLLLIMAAVDLGAAAGQAGRISMINQMDTAALHHHAYYTPALLLILLGAMSKSALVPLHFWLPDAMSAPTPVSAYLHSATMVKAGVYLLARLSPAMSGTSLWHDLLVGFGAATMLIAVAMAIGQHDLKRILAYSTVAVLGILVMLLGHGTDLAVKAAVVFLVAHALYKAALFMVVGIIDHATHTRDVRQLHGLRRMMPITATAALIAALSKAGAPPLFGFIGKEKFYLAKVDTESIVLIIVAVVTNVVLVATALMVAVWPF
ncbi:hypothetical protein GF412_05770, partial [Candidatus Micrarchaeota archaeon]|nr:hypothetical protein [Candidatus Micrarchaeota archaeon]